MVERGPKAPSTRAHRSVTAAGWCGSDYSPAGALLQGMSYLRSAQGAASAVQRSSAFDLAEQAFGQGLYAVQQTGAQDVKPSFTSLGSSLGGTLGGVPGMFL